MDKTRGLSPLVSDERNLHMKYFTPLPHFTPDTIRRTREALSMTRPELAAYLGVTAKAVEAWEYGKNQPYPLRRALSSLRFFPRGKSTFSITAHSSTRGTISPSPGRTEKICSTLISCILAENITFPQGRDIVTGKMILRSSARLRVTS